MRSMSEALDVRLGRRTVAWAIVNVLVLCVLTLGFDVVLVVSWARVRPSTLGAGLADGAALASLVTLVSAPLAASLEIACRRIATGAPRWRTLWPVPIAVTAAITGLVVSGLSLYGRTGGNGVVVGGFAATVTTIAVAALDRRRLIAMGVPFAILVAALGALVRFAWLRPTHQDLLVIVVVCALHGLATPLRRRLRRARAPVLATAMALVLASCAAVLLPQEDAMNRWRRRSDELARFQPSLRRSMRAVWDFDFDGYSPIFGGGDCDDTKAARNPGVGELPDGFDHNCNGVTPPLSPTPADRGLAAAVGTPRPIAGALDLVVLVSIDCLRADALAPDITPNLWRLAARGARMTRMHSSGSKTAHSLPYLQRPTLKSAPVATQLRSMGITSTAVAAIGVGVNEALAGFDRSQAPDSYSERWTAQAVTDLALADLGSRRGRHYLWVHYFDAHQPIDSRAGDVDRGPLPGSYVRQVGVIDHELGRLFDALEQRGDLARAAVIVTADHGEAFGAHGIPFHAGTPYEPLIHVPAIFVAPGIPPSQYDGLVSHRDIPLTTLAAFGADVGSSEEFGRSWFRLQDAGDAPLHAFVVSSGSASGMDEQREWVLGALVEPGRKVIERYDVRSFVLFDPIADPDEDEDLADAEPATASRLRRELAVFRDLDPSR
jgi:choline-sulfatase